MPHRILDIDEDLMTLACEAKRPMTSFEFAQQLKGHGWCYATEAAEDLGALVELRLISGPLRHSFAAIDGGYWLGLLQVDTDRPQFVPFVPQVLESFEPPIFNAPQQRSPILIGRAGLPTLLARALLIGIATKNATTVEDALGIPDVGAAETTLALSALETIGVELFGSVYDRFMGGLPDRHKRIVVLRTHAIASQTLEEVGIREGVSRERVRQLENAIPVAFEKLCRHPAIQLQIETLRSIMLPVMSDGVARQTTARFCVSHTPVTAFAALMIAVGPYDHSDGWWVLETAAERVRGLRAKAAASTDRMDCVPQQVIDDLTSGLFTNPAEQSRFVIEYLRLVRIHEFWALNESVKRRVLLALAHIGRPATKYEIAEVAGIEELGRVSSYLSTIDFVCHADKTRWAFRDWVDEPYDGIVSEIIQLIEEDGGETLVERLLQEIPRKFGTQAFSVKMYLATPLFVETVGRVRLATDGEIAAVDYGPVAAVPSAVQLGDGSWGVRLRVEERFLTGYSAGIPFAIARAGGVLPGDSLRVPVEGTSLTASLIWRAHNTAQTVDCGRIREALSMLQFRAGDEMIIAPSRHGVRILRIEHLLEANTQVIVEDDVDDAHVDTLLKVLQRG